MTRTSATVTTTNTTASNGEATSNETNQAKNNNSNGVNESQSQSMPSLSVNDDRHIENTVIFVPNVWTLMPTSVEYDKIAETYKNFIDNPPESASDSTTAKPTSAAVSTSVKPSNEATKPSNPASNAVASTEVKQPKNEASSVETKKIAPPPPTTTTTAKIEQTSKTVTDAKASIGEGESQTTATANQTPNELLKSIKAFKTLIYLLRFLKAKTRTKSLFGREYCCLGLFLLSVCCWRVLLVVDNFNNFRELHIQTSFFLFA